MPGGQRIRNVQVKVWNPEVDLSLCSLERGPCHRPDVAVTAIKDGEFYLEEFEDGTLTIYLFSEGLQLLLKEVQQLGKREGAADVKHSLRELIGA